MTTEEKAITNRQLDLLISQVAEPKIEALANSPLLTPSALRITHEASAVTQYGLIAGVLDRTDPLEEEPKPVDPESRLFFNTMAPSSTFICGSQGSGKSHTLSCLLENCLSASEAAVLPNPLTALVFHYDTFISDDGGSPCEASYLASISGIKVRVLCAPTNLATIRRTYSRLNVEVQPLQLKDSDLNTKRMLDLMAVNKEDASIPLYIHVIHRILREMRMDQQLSGECFDYNKFKARIDNADLAPAQLAPLNQRLSVLESFMSRSVSIKKKMKRALEIGKATSWASEPGLLTIVDLSCPCITPETACSLFNICLSIFLEQEISCGRVIALDEAHKYMTSSAESTAFTNNILSTVRLQRHLGVRIIIATQEPTISTSLLDLCSVIIIHRFTSPSWLRSLQVHVFTQSRIRSEQAEYQVELFQTIMCLKTGEALLFAPSAAKLEEGGGTNGASAHTPYLVVRIRARLSDDGGRSVLAK